MRRSSICLIAFTCSCATTPREERTIEPPIPEPIARAPRDEVKSSTRAAQIETVRAVPLDKPGALALLQEGREIQRERGEGGAEDAVAIYRRAVEKDPSLAAAYWEMGWSYQLLSKWDEVIDAWDHVRAIDPAYPDLGVHYPVALMRRDQARAIAALPDPGELAPPEETPRAGERISIAAVGDIQLGRAWPEERAELPPKGAYDVLAAAVEPLNRADITFGNLETVLADEGKSTKCGPKSTKCFAFRVPTSYAADLKKVGFEVMSVANNHSGDFGPEGRTATMEALDGAGILHSGVVGDIASWQTKGLKIGLVAFSTGGGLYRIQEIDVARKVVAEVARKHDLVIVSFHGGAEGVSAAHVTKAPELFYGEDRGDVHAFAHAMIDTGADLVLGHGPHLWRAMEIYKGRLIAYSMGNFCTWETFNITGPLGTTGVLKVELAPNGVATGIEVTPMIIEKPGRPKLDPARGVISIVRQLSKEDFGDPVIDENGRWKYSGKPRS